VIAIVLASSVVDRGFEPRLNQAKDYEIGICCFSAKHAALKSKGKDLLARTQDNMSECSDMAIRGLLFQCASTIKHTTKRIGLGQSGPHHHFMENELILAMI
jgi:hypothetical protein